MSIIEQAKSEMALVNFGADDSRVMVEILEKFFDQWDSGGAVHAVAPVLQRLIAGRPLSPLTGDDIEWIRPMDGMDLFQNRRCGSVFKEKDLNGNWIAYDIDRKPNNGVPDDAVLRHRWAANEITFPYMPERG